MAHFAQLDENSLITQVVVVNNETIDNLPFPESEPSGVAFCKSIYGDETIWKQTSYSSSFRYNYAGIGFTFISEAQPNGAFITPKPYPSWLLNTDTYQWEAPVPMPYVPSGYTAYWDEEDQEWYLVHTGVAT